MEYLFLNQVSLFSSGKKQYPLWRNYKHRCVPIGLFTHSCRHNQGWTHISSFLVALTPKIPHQHIDTLTVKAIGTWCKLQPSETLSLTLWTRAVTVTLWHSSAVFFCKTFKIMCNPILHHQTIFTCKRIGSWDGIVEIVLLLIIMSSHCGRDLEHSKLMFRISLWHMMMHHHAKHGYTVLSGSKQTVFTELCVF